MLFQSFSLKPALAGQTWLVRFVVLGGATLILWGMSTIPAAAHHAIAGQTPANFLEGFLSGLAHPIIGLDHFGFVVAIALLAALQKSWGLLTPIALILATIAGVGIHLAAIELPFPEVMVAVSVVGVGILLAQNRSLAPWVAIGVAIAGIFHGYAYGESIVGAEMTPLLAYLTGFTVIQLAVSLTVLGLGKYLQALAEGYAQTSRQVGFIILGVGLAFLASALAG